jgi:hypothetical protein
MFMPWDADLKNVKTKRHWMPSAREAMHQYARAIYPEISTNRILRQKMRVLNEYDAINVARRYWEPLFYKHWSVPVDERGGAPEVLERKAEEEEQEGLVVGVEKEVESLEPSLAPRLGMGKEEIKVIPVSPDIELNVAPGRIQAEPPVMPDVTKPGVVEKAEWPGEETEQTMPELGPETNKIISVDLQNLPVVCPKEDCEGEMVVLATGNKLGCKKCGHQIDSLGVE